jgi:hypothetical protein
MREIYFNNDHVVSYSTVERTTGLAITGLQLQARLSLTPNGPAASSGSIVLQTNLVEDPPCSGEYIGVFAGSDITAVLSASLFGVSGSNPGAESLAPGVYEIITSGSNLQVVTPFIVRAVRLIP